ncbi:DUF2207 domain-containing protein [Maritalea sp.]|jgi:uncharacterized membrane protein YgcG|uniref:DUF2207 domain-containing protein n=1 Tax=Maritalea sp. TaxID=2003361 RepID=UPI0039E67F91
MFFALVPAYGAEAILSYSSVIDVQTDRSIIVTETIRVNAEGRDIKRGIWRYIPTQSRGNNGYAIDHGLEVLEVLRDGEPDDWKSETEAAGERIYIGNADVFLRSGIYTYTLKYRTWRQVRDLPESDQIYWNATGNFWSFPIQAAVAQVRLPEGARIQDTKAFTGPFGSNASNATLSFDGALTAIFRANQSFAPGEGMSVVVGFDKGLMAPATAWDNFWAYLSDRRALFLPAISFLVVFVYFYSSWSAVGRDPKKGTIIPLFYAPEGFSPALTHYVHHFGWKKSGWTAFTSALISLATKGLVTLGQSGKDTKVTVTSKEPDDLPSGELKLYTWFHAKGSVTIDKKIGASLHELHSDFIETIEDENRRNFFDHNTGFVIVGLALSLLALFGMLYFEVIHFFWLVIAIVVGVVVAMISGMMSKAGSGPKFSRGIALFILIALFGNLTSGFISSLDVFNFDPLYNGDLWTNAKAFVNGQPGAIATISIVIINIGFGLTMRSATVQGRKVMDQIEGFKLYMETAEKERLNMRGAPDLTVERFEKILPYAIALGVEKPWSEHFENELARNALKPEDQNYNPAWHSGRGWRADRIASNIASTATAMSAAMIAAQPASASSSGFSSGGGFSGGGGGGGGGGGW